MNVLIVPLIAALANGPRMGPDNILLLDSPSSFCGVRLGKADYISAQRLWGRPFATEPGTMPTSARLVRLRDGTLIGYVGDECSPYHRNQKETFGDDRLIGGFTISEWKGHLAGRLLRVGKKFSGLGKLSRGESFSDCERSLRQSGIRFVFLSDRQLDKSVDGSHYVRQLFLTFNHGKLAGIVYRAVGIAKS